MISFGRYTTRPNTQTIKIGAVGLQWPLSVLGGAPHRGTSAEWPEKIFGHYTAPACVNTSTYFVAADQLVYAV